MTKVFRSLVCGPLEAYAAGFAEELLRQGYTRSSAEQHLCFVAHLSRWMATSDVELGSLSSDVIEEYFATRRVAGYANYRSVKALRPLLDYLAPVGVLPSQERVALGPVDALLERYRDYLLAERALTTATMQGYLHLVRPFVVTRLRGHVLDWAGLSAADVTGFVLAACPGRATGTAKLIVTAVRSLLRFLHLAGEISVSLESSVPSVAGWRLSTLPKGLEPAQLRRLLASCDRRTHAGGRDYAIMMLLSRLGLRAGEVAGLRLDDIDWHGGEIVVRGKGDRAERLPLPQEVGAAIAASLQHGRPATAEGRTVFVRLKAPHRALSSGGVTNVVSDAARRAGLTGPVHAHRLRHTAATQMLRAGSPLGEVGQVLRHRSPLSTAIYAKTDREALAVLARPWPAPIAGGVS